MNKFYKLFIIIISLVIIFNLLSIFNVSLFGFRIYRVGSGSMEPNIKINDIVIIKKYNDYNVNDIVTYIDTNNKYITHRIVKINDDEVITKGDSNNLEDLPFTKDKIVGKLLFKINVFSFINYFFSKPFSWIFLFIIGLFITIIIPDKKRI